MRHKRRGLPNQNSLFMRITYDRDSDSKYISLSSEEVAKTSKQNDWLLFDHDKQGRVRGVEILDASKNRIALSVIDNSVIVTPLEKEILMRSEDKEHFDLIEDFDLSLPEKV